MLLIEAKKYLAAALFRLEGSRDPETVREVLAAWLADAEQAELRYSVLVWLREAFFRTRLPGVEFPELNDLAEVRIMLSERVVDWTQQWKQEGRMEGEAMLLCRQLVRRFGALPAWAEQLEAWGDQVLEAETLTEVLGHPGH